MYLIPSAAYIDLEFQAELGRLPPCLLPVANQRLIELQVDAIRRSSQSSIFVSLPVGFELEQKEQTLFSKLNVNIIWLSADLSLGQSISEALVKIPESGKISILYGDTLIQDIPSLDNCIAIAKTRENYNWYVDEEIDGYQLVWAGYFSFESKDALLSQLRLKQYDFLETVQSLLDAGSLIKQPVEQWFDAGHINTYFFTRSSLTTERSFNSIRIDKNVVTKRSVHPEKIASEAQWFLNIPPNVKRLTPNLIAYNFDENNTFYSIEYLYYMPLNELAVHGRLPEKSWVGIYAACLEYFDEAKKTTVPEAIVENLNTEREVLIKQKTYERLVEFSKDSPIDLNQSVFFNNHQLPSVNEIVHELVEAALTNPACFTVIHGDFCFSNIIYDSRSKTIKMIDPRGVSYKGEKSVYGDLVYDLAKFAHSVIGFYDFIVAGAFTLEINGQHIHFEVDVNQSIQTLVELMLTKEVIEGVDAQTIMPLVILLFFSMLPLHSDSTLRQSAFLANALRLYCDFKGIK